MKPLDLLRDQPSELATVERLLREGSPEQVEAELSQLDRSELVGAAAAARTFAHGALALRTGALDSAVAAFDDAALALEGAGEHEASRLARCEFWLATIRRGPRKVYKEAIEALEQIGSDSQASRVVRVVAAHYRGTALRYTGQAEATLRVLLEAFGESDGLLLERAHVLNSLGTLYVVLGAFGAAQAVLEHAAELNHQIGDRVSEAISYGQLGSAALGRGELEEARRFLQRQEWFASRVGDTFGQSRALVLLADLAVDLGRHDDAVELAEQARTLAASVSPPLEMWLAYATRSIGRAKVEMGDTDAREVLDDARARFSSLGNQLGDAMVSWDLARLEAQTGARGQRAPWQASAWAFATLGLTARVTQVLRDLRELSDDAADAHAIDMAIAAASQSYPHLGTAQEVALVLSQPDTVAAIAHRRISGQRNLGRLAAHTLLGRGLYIAAVAAGAIGTGIRPMPNRRSAATLVGQLPGVAMWAWSGGCALVEVARDLSSLRVAVGEDSRAALGFFAEARVASAPFAGELGAEVHGADLAPLVRHALIDPSGTLRRVGEFAWSGEAEALARMSGFQSTDGS
jgi:tetratricopeptide (TPR) repeat protein